MVRKILITEPIVVVEDDLDDQFLLRKVFERIGIESELLFFTNGKEALHYLMHTEKETFLILCDINMPVMNGLELKAKINQSKELREKAIPFVYLSTAARPGDVKLAYEMTAQGFFVKETSLEQMEEALKLIIHYWGKCKHPNMLRRVF
jgi:CheY-like chemotaxis protein